MDTEEKERRAAIVLNDFNGILPYTEAFYIHSLIYSSGRCVESFERYHFLKDEEGIDASYLVSVLQEAVGHAAALSRYFWPSPTGKKGQKDLIKMRTARGHKLLEAFDLDVSSPLYDRELRNAWEHFDERLDNYLLEHEAGYFFPSAIIGSHYLADDPVGHIFKLLDKEENCLVLMNKKHFFLPLHKEAKRIHDLANTYRKNGNRLRKRNTENQTGIINNT